jgi:phospholipase C
MECFNAQTLPASSTLALSFALCDRWHASVPGPTQPNRMFVFSATSGGAANNNDVHLAEGYSQKTIFDSLFEAGHSIGDYYSDFPGALVMRHMRERKYWPYIKQISEFYKDCAAGTLPTFSFLEPRWFTVGDLGANDEHPPHDVALGEYIIANVYEALRKSPLWYNTLLIITYDEHGGFFDHVPTPTKDIPNPDGLVSRDPPFAFDRLGVRVPTMFISPWVSKGVVIHDPNEEQVSGEPGSCWDHTSIASSLKRMFNLPSFLTKRDAWAAHFESTIVMESKPRTDCPLELPVPGSPSMKARKRIEIESPLTDELLRRFEQEGRVSNEPLTDLQYEILLIASGLTDDCFDVYSLKTEHEGALYVRLQLKRFFGGASHIAK